MTTNNGQSRGRRRRAPQQTDPRILPMVADTPEGNDNAGGEGPEFEGNFFLFAYDAFAGLLGTPAVTGARGLVIKEVLARQWGWAKLHSAKISASELAKISPYGRTNIVRAIRELVAFRVLLVQEDGTLRFNRHFEEYDFGESDEEREFRVEQCRKYPERIKEFKTRGCIKIDTPKPGKARKNAAKGCIKNDTPDDIDGAKGGPDDRINSDTPPCIKNDTSAGIECIDSDTQGVSKTIQERIKNDTVCVPPLITPLVGVKNLTINNNGDAAQDSGSGNLGNGEVEQPESPSMPEPDPERLRQIQAKSEEYFPMLEGSGQVKLHSASYPLSWIDEALNSTIATQPEKPWKYLLGVLKGYRKDGGPEDAPGDCRPGDKPRRKSFDLPLPVKGKALAEIRELKPVPPEEQAKVDEILRKFREGRGKTPVQDAGQAGRAVTS